MVNVDDGPAARISINEETTSYSARVALAHREVVFERVWAI